MDTLPDSFEFVSSTGAKSCVRELHDLPSSVRDLHLHEMAEVAHALARAFNPTKLNYEALGNGTPHLIESTVVKVSL